MAGASLAPTDVRLKPYRVSSSRCVNPAGGRAPPLRGARRDRGSVAGAFTGRLGLLYPLRHLRLHGIEVEARAALHRRVIDEALEGLAHHLLDEHEPPELVLEPIEVLLGAFL